jgi:NAD(P)-dependent dehydrogenase (short-subunit alcohol dehydrogenase family)
MFNGGVVMMLLSGIEMARLRWGGPYPFVAIGVITVLTAWTFWTLIPGRHLRAVRSDIERAGGRAIEVVADVTSYDEVESMRKHVEAQLGPIDILGANAGANLTAPGQSVEDISEDGWQASIDANFTATFLCIKSLLPGMKQRRRGS